MFSSVENSLELAGLLDVLIFDLWSIYYLGWWLSECHSSESWGSLRPGQELHHPIMSGSLRLRAGESIEELKLENC